MLVQCTHPAFFQPKLKVNFFIKFRREALVAIRQRFGNGPRQF